MSWCRCRRPSSVPVAFWAASTSWPVDSFPMTCRRSLSSTHPSTLAPSAWWPCEPPPGNKALGGSSLGSVAPWGHGTRGRRSPGRVWAGGLCRDLTPHSVHARALDSLHGSNPPNAASPGTCHQPAFGDRPDVTSSITTPWGRGQLPGSRGWLRGPRCYHIPPQPETLKCAREGLQEQPPRYGVFN